MNWLSFSFNKKIVPPEFRVASPSSGDHVALMLDELDRLESALKEHVSREIETFTGPLPEEDGAFSVKEAVAMGKHFFSLEESVGLLREEKNPRRSASFLNTIQNRLKHLKAALEPLGLEYVNHTGDKYYPTLNVEVMEWENDSEASEPRISETIEPSVFFRGKLVHPAKVIVARKED